MTQLYGCFDAKTHEWTDGIIGRTFREMSTNNSVNTGNQNLANVDASNLRRWIIFDGPIDSAWIENLNTVLDDSKKLCLMNGEIMMLKEGWMNIVSTIQRLFV